jgi:hypothetical protein
VKDCTYDDACKNQDRSYDQKNFLYAHCRFLSHLREGPEVPGSRCLLCLLNASTEADEIAFRSHSKS